MKCVFLAIGCSSVATLGVGGAPGGLWGGRAWAKVGWGQQCGGGGHKSGGRSTVGVFSTSKNRRSHHKYKFPQQFEQKGSIRALKARWALPVYPVFEDKKSEA